jgi:hypothetical protein
MSNRNLRPVEGGCTNYMEKQDLFIAKNLPLQEVTIILRGNDNDMPVYFEMPSNYTINDIGAKNVVINIRQMTVRLKAMADSM